MPTFWLAADMFKIYFEFRLTDFSSFLRFVFVLCENLPPPSHFFFLLLKFFNFSCFLMLFQESV